MGGGKGDGGGKASSILPMGGGTPVGDSNALKRLLEGGAMASTVKMQRTEDSAGNAALPALQDSSSCSVFFGPADGVQKTEDAAWGTALPTLQDSSGWSADSA